MKKTSRQGVCVLARAALAAVYAMLVAACGTAPEPVDLTIAETCLALPGNTAEPFGIAVANDAVYISDGQNDRILRSPVGGEIAEFAAGLDTPSAIAAADDGTIYVTDTGRGQVIAIEATGTVNTIAGERDGTLKGPIGIAVSDDGRVFVSDTYNDRIAVIENGIVRTLAGGTRGFADGDAGAARFDTPLGIAVWNEGRLLVADAGNRRIRVVEPDGSVWTLAGNGSEDRRDGPLHSASFVRPTAIAVSPAGVVYIADGNAIRRIGNNILPFVETVAGGGRGYADGDLAVSRFSRPSGLAFTASGDLLIADSGNGVVRRLRKDREASGTASLCSPNATPPDRLTAQTFRELQAPRWPYDPPSAPRDVAGTLGEIRGEISETSPTARFHNGLDIAGAYGETTRFVRDEKVLDPMSAENFGTLRELLRLPTIGYIHIRLGRDANDRPFGDDRFLFDRDEATQKLSNVRVPRGARFRAGEAVGTLNAMNHVHLIAGRSGDEMNALAALSFPGVADTIKPTISGVELFDENWAPLETLSGKPRIKQSGRMRVVVEAFDRMDGNPERRRLGLYRIGYLVKADGNGDGDVNWTIRFDRTPPNDAAHIAYARGSRSGPTGETVFRYIATNRVDGNSVSEGFIDTAGLSPGIYSLQVFAADLFGNIASNELKFEVIK